MVFAYLRKSTTKESQKHDRQKLAIQGYSEANGFTVDQWVEETVSGSVNADNRPLYNDMKKHLRQDDVLIITDIDRLGRNADDTIAELKDLKKQGVRVVALDVPHMNQWDKVQDGSIYDMIIDIVITLKAHMAQQEKEKIVARINQGLDVAKAKGTKLGRPQAELPADFVREYKKFKDGEYGKMSAVGFAKMLGIGRSTLYKYINLYDEQQTQ
mgnify:CR=1 FL=1